MMAAQTLGIEAAHLFRKTGDGKAEGVTRKSHAAEQIVRVDQVAGFVERLQDFFLDDAALDLDAAQDRILIHLADERQDVEETLGRHRDLHRAEVLRGGGEQRAPERLER